MSQPIQMTYHDVVPLMPPISGPCGDAIDVAMAACLALARLHEPGSPQRERLAQTLGTLNLIRMNTLPQFEQELNMFPELLDMVLFRKLPDPR